MRLVIKFFPEIMVKSRSLRRNMSMVLASNIRNLSRDLSCEVTVKVLWDQLDMRVRGGSDADRDLFLSRLAHTPGIDRIEYIERFAFEQLDDLIPAVITHYADDLKDKSFRVRVKRRGKHSFKSYEAEQFFGGHLLDAQPACQVDLHNPEIVVSISITDQEADLISRIQSGIGGFPMGTQGQVLSLLSGGFDSGVSSYLSMRRGFKTHYCFFNLGGINHEIGVKQLADYLWHKYSFSHRVQFVTVPFEAVVEEILTKVHHSQMGVVLKRLMMRAANRIAGKLQTEALVTGESLAQVSSQTLTNLNLIDKVSDCLIIRPLVVMDKPDIIKTARQIGTEKFALSMPEYCAVISDKPTSSAKESRILNEEQAMDMTVLEAAIESATVEPVDRILDSVATPFETEEVKTPAKDDVIIDIRHPEDSLPLPFSHNKIINIPFYQLHRQVDELDPGQRYLLYCTRGVMSHLQVAQLNSEGYQNFLVLKA